MCNRGITNCRIELEWNFLKNTGKIVRCAEIFTVEATVKSYGHFIRKNIDRIALQEGYTSEEYDTWLSMLDFNYEYIDYPEGTIWFTSDESITSEYSIEGSIWRINYNEEIPKELHATNKRKLEIARDKPELIKNVDASYLIELLIAKGYKEHEFINFFHLLESGSYELCVQMIS